jgi:hypothetical protein
MDERTRRVGLNEALFREVNERIEQLEERFGLESEILSIVCECGDASCTERIHLTHEQYAELRTDPLHFAVVKGHDIPDLESVIAERQNYDVVRKRPGSPAEIAEATEP